MKNSLLWNGLIIIPSIGIILIYAFICMAVYKLGVKEVYDVNPIEAIGTSFYYITYYFFSFGIIVLLVMSLMSLICLIFKREFFFSKKIGRASCRERV